MTVYMFSQVSSTSNCLDNQAKRLGMSYWRPAYGALAYCHTVNSTGLAVPRVLLALLENYEDAKCYVRLPAPLATTLHFEPSTQAAAHVPIARSLPLPLLLPVPLRPVPVPVITGRPDVLANTLHEPSPL